MIEAEAEPQNAVWEPWQPRIGQRVRVRLSGECRAEIYARDKDGVRHFWRSHYDCEDGMVGTVQLCPFSRRHGYCGIGVKDGHRWAVRFDTPVDLPLVGPKNNAHYAAIELEPLE